MRFVVDGEPRETIAAKDARGVVTAKTPYVGSGRVLPPEAVARKESLGCFVWIGSLTAAIWGFFLFVGLFREPGMDQTGLRLSIALAGFLVPAVLLLFKNSTLRKVRKKAAADYPEAPPPGTRIAVDDEGLTVGERRFSWDDLAIERLELRTMHTEDDSYLRPFSILVSTPAGPTLVSHRILDDGVWMEREIHRRLWPRALTELGLDSG
jgi:hypothetical protein